MFTKILIANRGEIACRIIRTARRLKIKTVAIYSTVDANALHVELADEAYPLDGASSQTSYLKAEKIIQLAKESGAEAIHPGYGFLAENAEFAKRCQQEKVIFIGPSTDSINLMGDKRQAKIQMQQADVPTTPGYNGAAQDDNSLLAAAKEINWPVLIKAAAGGGGKGMRLANNENEFTEAVQSAKREAKSSFGNDQLILEKYLSPTRHVEVQIFADSHGNTLHLFHRDCSLQRRHQKVIEEAPAPNLPTKLEQEMYHAAINAAKAINYIGAGTIEFLVAGDKFYFMEMNTRLQVEHPVTEMITGIDCVEWQLLIAAGERLPLAQSQIKAKGHAVEARIYAEDPKRDFVPAIGKLNHVEFPNGDGIRIDTGVQSNDTISIYYDPMIAKLISYADDRKTAIKNLSQALTETAVVGVTSNIPFLHQICNSKDFIATKLNTGFIDKHLAALIEPSVLSNELIMLAACIQHQLQYDEAKQKADRSCNPNSPWFIYDNWSLDYKDQQTITLWQDSENYSVTIQALDDKFNITFNNKSYMISFKSADGVANITINKKTYACLYFKYKHQLHLFYQAEHFALFDRSPQAEGLSNQAGDNKLAAPMPGAVITVLVKPGQTVKQGETLMILEAMKMEHSIKAPSDGAINKVNFKAGELVNEGVELVEFESNEAE